MSVHGWFTLGGSLAAVWKPSYPLLPWALSSALLIVAGLWDYWTARGPIEWMVVGLAAYELMLGLLHLDELTARAAAPSRSSSPEVEAARR